jgi:hypothetical protein
MEPVAMIVRRALMAVLSTTIRSGLAKRALPAMTLTPSAARRSGETLRDVRADAAEIDLEGRAGDAEGRPGAQRFVQRGGGEQRLGRHGAGGEIAAAGAAFLDKDDGNPGRRRGSRRGYYAGPRADHAYIGGEFIRHPPPLSVSRRGFPAEIQPFPCGLLSAAR